MRPLPTFLLIFSFVLAGCVGDPTPTAAEPSVDPRLPDFRPVQTEPETPRTLLEAPKYKQGEWWKIRMTDGFTGATYETTRVIVGVEGDYYLVGMPRESFNHDFMVLHIPGFGQVSREDLSFEIHDALFQPLRFPMFEGDSWVTAFEGRPVTMTVRTIESETRAIVQMVSNSGQSTDNANLTYDAVVGEVVLNDQPNYASYEVVEHGFNYTGIVTVPHQHDLIFQHFRIGGPLVSGFPAVATSNIDNIAVDTTYDRVSAAIIYFPIGPNTPAGYFSERVTSPQSDVFQMTVMPAESTAVRLLTFFSDRPGGQWTLEHVAGGLGGIGAEGIAYHIYDVDMPSGRVLASTGEHQHGG
jgi:hypothetical protein